MVKWSGAASDAQQWVSAEASQRLASHHQQHCGQDRRARFYGALKQSTAVV